LGVLMCIGRSVAARSALLGSVAVFSSAIAAIAQDQTAPGQDRAQVERIVVTATKRSESVRDVAMNVTAITGADLERQRATNFEDYVGLVPGMTYTSDDPGRTQLTLRGLNTDGVASTVGTYLDETPYGSSSALAEGATKAANLDTFDIERIEVLRGPQGTLYGANTLGGLLKFVTYKPDASEFDHKVEYGGEVVEDGDMGAFFKGMVNVPLGDELAARAVGYYRHIPGYIDDPGRGVSDINETDVLGGRAMLRYEPSDDFSIDLMAVAQNLDAASESTVDVLVGPGNTISPAFGDLTQRRLRNEYADVRYRVYNATVNWDLAWAELVSSTSWGTYDESSLEEVSAVLAGSIGNKLGIDKFTQEVRIASTESDSAWDWLAGAFFTHERAKFHNDIIGGPLDGLAIDLNSKFIEKAAFANITYRFSEAFDVSVGGRYSMNDQSATQSGLGSAGGDSSEEVFTYSIAPRWHLSEETMLYARVAKGYRPGGPNTLPPPPIPPGVPTTFASDTATNYEVGIKTDLLDSRLLLDATAFFVEWDNIQLLFFIPGFGGANGNGGTAESKGVELAAAWALTDELTLRATAAYVDAYLTADTDPIIIGGVSGDPLPLVPEWSGSLSGEYRFATESVLQPWIGATWRHVGERWSGFDPAFGQIPLESYDVLDVRVGFDHGMWTAQLYAKNLTDERGIVSFTSLNFSSASGTASASVITPRTIGLAVTGRF
jgi:iron complex outermembrane recepter protein